MARQPNQFARLPFSDFSPDVDSLTRGSIRDMLGFYPSEKGVRTLPGFTPYQTPLAGKIMGSHSAVAGGDPLAPIVAAISNRLFQSTNGGPFISAALPFTNTVNRWRFDNYGPDLIAVNGVDAPVVSTNDGPFALLGGNPPIFSIIQATDNAIVGVVANSQQWFSTLVDTNWTPNILTQTIQAFITNTPGNITAAVQLRGGMTFFKNRALHFAQFTGPPFFWNVGVVSHQVGTPCQEAAVPVRDVLYFWGPDDFYTFDGYSVTPIQNNLREFVFGDVNKAFLNQVAGYYDENNGPIVKWHYSSRYANPAGSLDSYVCLNIRFGTWGFGRQNIDLPLFGLANTSTGTQAGLFLPDHGLRLFDPSAPLASPSVTSNDIGDGHYLYQVTRARPRFNIYPLQAPIPAGVPGPDGSPFETYPAPGPSLGTVELEQLYTYIAGQPLRSGVKQAIDQDGWFNAPMTQRMQRFKLTVHDPCELVELELQIAPAGEV